MLNDRTAVGLRNRKSDSMLTEARTAAAPGKVLIITGWDPGVGGAA